MSFKHWPVFGIKFTPPKVSSRTPPASTKTQSFLISANAQIKELSTTPPALTKTQSFLTFANAHTKESSTTSSASTKTQHRSDSWIGKTSQMILNSSSLKNPATPAMIASSISITSLASSLSTMLNETLATRFAQITDSTVMSATPTSSTQPGQGHSDGKGSYEAQKPPKMGIIILCSVLGFIALVASGFLLWHYYRRNQSKLHTNRTPTPDEDEFQKWRQSSWRQLDSAPQTPMAAQRHSTQRYHSQPSPIHSFDHSQSSPNSVSSLLNNHNTSIRRLYDRRDLPSPGHITSATRGFMHHRAEITRPTSSLKSRPPTPLFGGSQGADEEEEVPQVPSHRPSHSFSIPRSPFVGSPMSSEFDFGFQQRSTVARSERLSNTSLSSNEPTVDSPRNI